MEQLHGFPYFRLEFNKSAAPLNAAAAAELAAWLRGGGAAVTDLAVISHGWNNNTQEAQGLYSEFFQNASAQWNGAGLPAGRNLAVAGVFWPSKRFTDSELIPGGAASLEDETPVERLQSALRAWAETESDAEWKTALLHCAAEAPRLEGDPALQDAWVRRLLELLNRGEDDDLEGVNLQRDARGRDILQAFAPPLTIAAGAEEDDAVAAVSLPGSPDADVSAAGFGNLLGGITGGAAKFLNLFTYYTMKERAGVVGAKGVSPVLKQIAQARPDLRIHLVGHSFGGRLVASVASQGSPQFRSLTLLQAAFSHYGFSSSVPAIGGKPGFFRPGLAAVSGPVLVTHTVNDTAVGVAYAVASRTANQIAAGVAGAASNLVGGPNDPYGGIGRNGAQLTPESVQEKLLAAGSAYDLKPGKVHNLQADAFIKDHGDVRGPQVTWAWLNALKSV